VKCVDSDERERWTVAPPALRAATDWL